MRGSEWSRQKREDGRTVALEEFTPWRDSVEARLGTLEAVSDQHTVETGDQRGHLVSMDEDLSKIQVEFRAQRGMLQALHDTQSEHITVLREHTSALAELRAGQRDLRRDVAEARWDLTEVRVGIRTIVDLLKPADDAEDGNSPD